MQRQVSTAADVTPTRASTNTVQVAQQQLTIFAESPAYITALLADIRQARRRVWIETYIFADDNAGRELAAALTERVAAGVEVRLMVDAVGSFSTPRALFDSMRKQGVQVHLFHDFGEALSGLKFLSVLNQRNHRKLAVIDDEIAYFGGMNIVDQSSIHTQADVEARNLPSSAGWRDVHVRLVGRRAADIAAICQRLWQRVHHLPSRRAARWPKRSALFGEAADAIFFFDSRPAIRSRRPARVLVPLLKQARREVTMAVAYFVPMGRVLREMLRARKRGVRVRVIVPGQSDVRLVQWATRHFYEFLLSRGIEIYERKDRMLHSKVLIVDGRYSIIGSCNLDARSLLLNLEFFSLIRSQPLAAALARICDEEIQNSVRIDEDYCRRRGWWERLRDRAAWSLRKWL